MVYLHQGMVGNGLSVSVPFQEMFQCIERSESRKDSGGGGGTTTYYYYERRSLRPFRVDRAGRCRTRWTVRGSPRESLPLAVHFRMVNMECLGLISGTPACES